MSIEQKQLSFLNKEMLDTSWQNEWVNMPEYNNQIQPEPEIIATFKFRNQKDFEKFKKRVKECIYDGEKVFDGYQEKKRKQAWYPLGEKGSKYLYINKKTYNPRFPVYIVSKGRWARNPTSEALKK